MAPEIVYTLHKVDLDLASFVESVAVTRERVFDEMYSGKRFFLETGCSGELGDTAYVVMEEYRYDNNREPKFSVVGVFGDRGEAESVATRSESRPCLGQLRCFVDEVRVLR